MNYINDLILNFNDCSDLFEFYEWSNKDKILNVDKIPIIRISKIQMSDIFEKRIRINKSFLNKLKNKTIISEYITLKYCLLVTDLNRVIALKFDEDGEVVESSSLLFDEEDAVIDECLNFKEEVLDYEVLGTYKDKVFLTRYEKIIRDELLIKLKNLYENKFYDEIDYLYEELFDDKKNVHEKYEFLIKNIENNYEDKYNKLYDIIKLTL